VLVARAVAEDQGAAWIVAGDFNDVAWSHTTRLFKRLSGLHDPRIGRGLLNTYHARRPLLRYPLDHTFMSAGFAVHELRRVRAPGSDHFAVKLRLHPGPRLGAEPRARGR
jgi:endonuclease/exonuclease/phosphatase (EEP) superfamily protein YafD